MAEDNLTLHEREGVTSVVREPLPSATPCRDLDAVIPRSLRHILSGDI